MLDVPDQLRRAGEYTERRGLSIANQLGAGTDGSVWRTSRDSAVKAFHAARQFLTELACYQRLRREGIRSIGRFAVPRLLDADEGLLALEMTIVTPPYLLDFGKAYLDHEPEHSPETLEDHIAGQRELWEDRYGEIQAVLWRLEQIGIFYRDATPRNISFGDN